MNRRDLFKRLIAVGVAASTLDGKALKAALTPPIHQKAAQMGMSGSMIPELWARESLRTLQENMVMGNLIERDFAEVAVCADKINTRRTNKPLDFRLE